MLVLQARNAVILWSHAQIQLAQEFYMHHFPRSHSSEDCGAEEEAVPRLDFSSLFLQGDIGVHDVATITHSDLLTLLGLPSNGLPPYMRPFEGRNAVAYDPHTGAEFNDACSPLPQTVYESPEKFEEWLAGLEERWKDTPPHMLPALPNNRLAFEQEIAARSIPRIVQLLRPHPHQLQAVAVVLRRMFHTALSDNAHSSTLIADAMGLGKTYSTFLTIAITCHLRNRQGHKGNLPPWLTSCTADYSSPITVANPSTAKLGICILPENVVFRICHQSSSPH